MGLDAGEFNPNDPRCLGTDLLKSLEPVSNCPELVDRRDAVLPQPCPSMAGQTEFFNGSANTFQ
jgi:hypothetical protein